MLSLICLELGVTQLVDPGTDMEDERPTPAVSPLPIVDVVPLSSQADVDVELFQVFQDVGALPAMVTPVGDPEGVHDDSCEVPRAPGFIGGDGESPGGDFPGWASRGESGGPDVVVWVGGSVVGVSDVTGDVHA